MIDGVEEAVILRISGTFEERLQGLIRALLLTVRRCVCVRACVRVCVCVCVYGLVLSRCKNVHERRGGGGGGGGGGGDC